MSEFNLLDEKWILVLNKEGGTEKVSLLEVFKNSNDYVSLANELPTVDFVILRLLLAIMHSSLTREINKPRDAIDLWDCLWENGLPYEEISQYLEKWRSRFYLFDDHFPFYQIGRMKDYSDKQYTAYAATKLVGSVSQSGNKARHFCGRNGKRSEEVDYDEAARWLLHINGFDDSSGKEKDKEDNGTDEKKDKSSGVGWLGKLGAVYADGKNLAETLLLNFVLLDEKDSLWPKGIPAWELDTPRYKERTRITAPKSQIELLTLQSRRLYLNQENGFVSGFRLLGGDFFSEENAKCEQMTMWRKNKSKHWVPKQHSISEHLWRDFGPLAAYGGEDNQRPGVIRWIDTLNDESEVFRGQQIKCVAVAVEYGANNGNIGDISADSVSFNAELLSQLKTAWVNRICDVLDSTKNAIHLVGMLAAELAEAKGDKRGGPSGPNALSPAMIGKRNAAKVEAYFILDQLFREWLEGINPSCDTQSVKLDEWRDTLKKELFHFGKELVTQAGPAAATGVIRMKNGRAVPINSFVAYNKFVFEINKELKKEEVNE